MYKNFHKHFDIYIFKERDRQREKEQYSCKKENVSENVGKLISTINLKWMAYILD